MNAWEAARDAYLAERPRPGALDVDCPRCRAVAGETCSGRAVVAARRVHAARIDRARGLGRDRAVAAERWADRVVL